VTSYSVYFIQNSHYQNKEVSMSKLSYANAIQKLEAGDSFTLQDMKNLSYADLDKLFEEIKYWKVYGKTDTKINEVKRW